MKKVLVIVAVVAALLLSACGRASGDETPTPTVPGQTPEQIQVESTEVVIESTHTPYPTSTPTPTGVPTPAETTPVEATVTPGTTEPVAATAGPQEPTAESSTPSPTATASAPPAPTDVPTVPVSQVTAGRPVELTRLEDANPGPPFSILVSTIRILDDGYYKLTGRIRNDGSQVYRGAGVYVTFYTNDEPQNQHSLGKVYGACGLLAPGADCPFSAELYPRNYVSYILHPDGMPVEYSRPAPLVLTNVTVEDGWVGYVRIRGTATNENPFPVRDGIVSGILLDAARQIVSVGWTPILGEIAPGASMSFDLNIEQVPYAHYQLQAQATRD